MFRTVICVLALATLAPAARAGELDREAAPAGKAPAAAVAPGGSEMDRESPQAAHGWRWGHRWGGWGWGGYYPARFSYAGFGFPGFYYRPYSFALNIGFGYRPFFPAYYYSPFGYWWW